MRHRYIVLPVALAGLLTAISLAMISVAGQTPATSKLPAAAKPPALPKPGPAPKTAWGTPNLEGTWFVMENVPLERSAANAGKAFLTDAEVAERDKQLAANPGRNSRSENAAQDVNGAYNAVFNSILKTSKRTSMIINPEDGCIPPLTAEAQQGQGRGGGRGGGCVPAGAAAPPAGAAAGGRGGGAGAAAAPAQGGRGGGGAAGGAGAQAAAQGGARGGGASTQNDNPETTAQSPRCLGVQMPFLATNPAFAQGTVMQIVQGPKSMAIYMEDDHAGGGNRVIFLDGRPHAPANVKKVLGDSIGRWEGNTLVVETTNFAQGFRGSSPDTYKMIERFTRVDSNNLRREITFDDPKTWTKPWTVLIEMGKTDDRRHMIFDSACHEGNYGMTGILIGARKEEAAAKK